MRSEHLCGTTIDMRECVPTHQTQALWPLSISSFKRFGRRRRGPLVCRLDRQQPPFAFASPPPPFGLHAYSLGVTCAKEQRDSCRRKRAILHCNRLPAFVGLMSALESTHTFFLFLNPPRPPAEETGLEKHRYVGKTRLTVFFGRACRLGQCDNTPIVPLETEPEQVCF